MKRVIWAAVAAVAIVGAPSVAADDPLAPMSFLVGSCWKGAFPGGGNVTDTHCFEPVYGGTFIRDRHIVEGAPRPYAGETLYRWDAATRTIRYAYYASDGGHSDGTARAVDGTLVFDDRYSGADGAALVMRATWTRAGDDAYEALTEAQEGGVWKAKFKVRFQRVPAPGKVSAQFPDVRDTSWREADGSGVIRVSTTVRASAATLWTALSTAEGWKRWAVKQAWVDFRLGGMIETNYDAAAVQGARVNIKNRIEAFSPGQSLSIRNVQAAPDFQHAEEFSEVVTTILLVPRGDNETEVVLTAVGFRPGPAFDALYTRFIMGDSWTLQNLKRVMEAPG